MGLNIKKFYDSSDSFLTNLRTAVTLTANRIVTFPDASGEILLDSSTQTLTGKTLTAPIVNSAYQTSLGSTPVGTVSIKEYSADGHNIVTVLTLTNFIVGALAGAGAALGVGNIVYAFPASPDAHIELTSYFSLSLTAAGTAVAVAKVGLGSVIATGAVSVLNGTPTFMDRLTEQSVPTASTGGAVTVGVTNVTAGLATGIGLNVAASVKNVFLNTAATWNANNSGNLTATGTVVLSWIKLV